MSPPIKLLLSLERRDRSGITDLGQWDLTLPALFAIQDGVISTWLSGKIPSSAQLSLSVPHVVRQASWDASLFVKENDRRLESFLKKCAGVEDIAGLISKIEVLQSVTSLRVHAEALLDAVLSTRYLSEDSAKATHPLTGQILKSDTYSSLVPFRFGFLTGRWNGVKPDDLADFMRETRLIDARTFVSTILTRSHVEALDTRPLDDALVHLARTGDFSTFKTVVEHWNRNQHVLVDFSDPQTIVVPDGATGYDIAVNWCQQYLQSVYELEQGVKEFLSSRDSIPLTPSPNGSIL
jgi:hypothetical protein